MTDRRAFLRGASVLMGHAALGPVMTAFAATPRKATFFKQPEMREQQRARPWIGDAAEHRDVQEREHRHHDQAPVALAESPRRIGQPGEERFARQRRLHKIPPRV